jgi:hypothetical protein
MNTVTSDRIKEFADLQDQLKSLKKKEADMRVQILDDLFPAAGVGTLNTAIGDYTVKGSFKNSITIDKKMLSVLEKEFSDDELACIEYKPSLSLSKYKLLDISFMLDECLITKPAMPTLEIKWSPTDD